MATPKDFLTLAVASTGQGLQSRIVSLQLLTKICETQPSLHIQTTDDFQSNNIHNGHVSVSEAFSTLRFHLGEPGRFRILIGILNSGGCGGIGELQTIGLQFFNTFLNSSENLQNRLYIQAELSQAGFDPNNLTKVYRKKIKYNI